MKDFAEIQQELEQRKQEQRLKEELLNKLYHIKNVKFGNMAE